MLRRLESNHDVLVTLEEHSQRGGFGSAVLEELAQNDIRFAKVRIAGVPDHFVTFGSRQELLAECRLDVAGIVAQGVFARFGVFHAAPALVRQGMALDPMVASPGRAPT